jgi:hypothetical protein
MENRKEKCENLIKKWKELKEKMPKDQTYIPGKPVEPAYITPEEMDEFYKVMKQLKNECQEFLSPAERFEINERIK